MVKDRIPTFLIACLASLPSLVPAKDFKFVEGSGYMDLLYGETPVYRHVNEWDPKNHSKTFKVFHHLHGFHGEGFLTKGPGGEFTHHRGLFLGWSQTSTAGKQMDSWHGSNGSSTRHARYLPEREIVGADRARRASVTEWTMQDNSVIVRDTREVTAWFPSEGKLYLDWSITIASATGDTVFLNGDPQHAGFQFRADSTITAFDYLGPADKTGTGDVWTMKDNNSWAVSRFALKTHGYAVMQMDHPSNPRPVVVSHRDYGRFGHYFTAKVPADKPLTFHFRTMVLDTDRNPNPTQAQAQAIYDEFARSTPGSTNGTARSIRIGKDRNRSALRVNLSRNPWVVGRDGSILVPTEVFGIGGRRIAPGNVSAPGALILKP